jgi:hypothetical protein
MRYTRIALLSAAAIGLLPFASPSFAEGRSVECARCGGAYYTALTKEAAPVMGPHLRMVIPPTALALAPGTAVEDPPRTNGRCDEHHGFWGLERYNGSICP